MDTVFSKVPDGISTKSSDDAYGDDILEIPFSATKLRHSLSEGSKPRKPVNGYNRMHSFHSTLADDWKNDGELDSSKTDSRFLPADFTETLFNDFSRLYKNGYQSHSFDEGIFEGAADKFSDGFFSESEIDDIPRSSLFHRAGLRRSTSYAEPRGASTRQDRKEDRKETARATDEKSSRQAKIEELLRLRKQLEELKSWQASTESKQETLDNGNDSSTVEKTSKNEEEDLVGNRLKVMKEKGKMKRRRLSSSKKSNSLSSKLMEELLEEEEEPADEGVTPSPEKDSRGKYRTRSSSDMDDLELSPSLRRESFDESFKLSDRLGKKQWQDDFNVSLFNRHADFSVRKKSMEKPLRERKFSLNSDDTAPPRGNDDFRRSFSTSFDLNGMDKNRRESFSKRTPRNSKKDDKSSTSDIAKNAMWKSQRDEDVGRRDDKHADAHSFHSEDVSSSVTSNNFKTSFDLRGDRDRSREELQQRRKSQERNSKKSLRQDTNEVDDFFRKFSLHGVPRKDFFEHESFARDDRRKKLMEEIGGIQRHLADITKHELRGSRQRPKTVDEDEGSRRQDMGELGPRRRSSVLDLQAERSTLIDHLKQLLCQKQEREQEIRKRLDRLKKEASPESPQETKDEMERKLLAKEVDDKENVTSCNQDKKEIREPIQRVDEDEVSFILRSAGAEQYIPIIKKNEVTIDKLYQFMPADFAELGITNPALQQRLQEEIDKHFVEQKNAQLKAAELVDSPKKDDKSKLSNGEGGATGTSSGNSTPCTPIVDAPEGYEPDVPVHVTAECVVCLDRQSNLLFLNCGHVCCCYDCSIDLSLCPLCRAEIAAKLIMNDCLPE